MLASSKSSANAACAGRQQAVLAPRSPIRPLALNSVQQQAQTLLVPTFSNAQAIGQRVRAAAVAGAWAQHAAAVSTCCAVSAKTADRQQSQLCSKRLPT
jgi:hypothetical protein